MSTDDRRPSNRLQGYVVPFARNVYEQFRTVRG